MGKEERANKRTRHGVIRHNLHHRPLLVLNRLGTPQEPRADLGSLGVEHHAHMHAGAGGEGFPETVEGGGVCLVVAVGEIEPGDVHA